MAPKRETRVRARVLHFDVDATLCRPWRESVLLWLSSAVYFALGVCVCVAGNDCFLLVCAERDRDTAGAGGESDYAVCLEEE